MMPAPLIESLGVHWEQPAAVTALAWSAAGASVGVALGDGYIVVADTHWPQGPKLVTRPEGGVLLQPATMPASQPLRASCHPGASLCIVADARGAFLSGGDGGHVVRLPRLGAPEILSHQPGAWIDAVACTAHDTQAHSSGKRVYRMNAQQGATLALPATATALVFSPDEATLAIAHYGGGMQENALHGWRVADGGDIEMGGYPGQPLSLGFSHDGRYLATSGGTRPVCWGFDPPGLHKGPVECGIASRTPVTRVACHPKRSLIAAGYHNGAVMLCQPGRDDSLFVRGSGGGAVNALAWSGDGARLAFGTQGGVFGWLDLPEILFRTDADETASAPVNALTEAN